MSDFGRKDDQLEEILSQIRRKREAEEMASPLPQADDLQTAARPVQVEDRQKETGDIDDALPEDLSLQESKSSVLDTQDPETEDMAESQKKQTAEYDVKAAMPRQPDETPKDGRPEKGRRRSLLRALSGRDAGDNSKDINKRMLAPTLVPGDEELMDTEEIEVPEVFQESHQKMTGAEPEKHPVFSASQTPETVIPQPDSLVEIIEETVTKQTITADNEEMHVSFISEEVEQIRSKGVLNVRENSDDEEFKTFFSNTVVIDSKPLSQRRQRPKRVTDFVEGEDGGPVFEEREDTGEEIAEYRSDDETEEVMSLLTGRVGRLFRRTLINGLVVAITFLFNLLFWFEILLPESLLTNTTAIAGVNAALMFVLIAVNYRSILKGFVKLVTFRANADSVTSFAVLMALIEPIVAIALKSNVAGFSAVVASFAIFFGVLGKYISAKRVLRSFASISADYEKYATTVLDDDAFVRRLTRELTEEDACVLIKRKTGFTDDFLSHAMSKDIVNETISKPASIGFFLAILCGIVAYVMTKNIMTAVHTISMAAILMAPFTSTLASSLPIDWMQKALSRLGCVVPGFSAADEVVDANCVVLEGREIFPRGNVLLHGIKTFERERIDKAILYAASVLIQSCDTMSHMFLNVIQNKTEMLYNVDNIVYEDGLGFSCWIDQTRILVGTRELLESRDIEVPSRDYENRYTKSTTRDAIYLAVSGRLYAMFVVSYSANKEVERAMRGFEQEGICVLVRTRDFNITAEKIARTYNVPRSMVSIVEEHDMEELARKTAYVSHTPSAFTHIGSLSSYVGGILSCYRLQGALKLATTIELVAMVVGALLAVLFTVFEAFSLNVFTVLLFQTVWLVATYLATMLRRH